MDHEPDSDAVAKAARGGARPTREDRLKAALKANMARRKAQARAKGARSTGETDGAVRDGEAKTE